VNIFASSLVLRSLVCVVGGFASGIMIGLFMAGLDEKMMIVN